jgi:hypothetical protein
MCVFEDWVEAFFDEQGRAVSAAMVFGEDLQPRLLAVGVEIPELTGDTPQEAVRYYADAWRDCACSMAERIAEL